MGRKKLKIAPLCGKRIKQLCKRKGITQAELAKVTGYTPHTISQIVTGKRGLSLELADKIIKIYPEVSKDWLLGDQNATMSMGENLYISYKESSERRHALESLLSYTDFQIGSPYELYGINDYFYDIIYRDGTKVAVSRAQLDGLVNNIIDIINSYFKGIIRNGMPAEKLMDSISDLAASRLDEICARVTEIAESDDEKRYIEAFTRSAKEEIQRYNNLKYPLSFPGETEDDIKKEIFKEFQDE